MKIQRILNQINAAQLCVAEMLEYYVEIHACLVTVQSSQSALAAASEASRASVLNEGAKEKIRLACAMRDRAVELCKEGPPFMFASRLIDLANTIVDLGLDASRECQRDSFLAITGSVDLAKRQREENAKAVAE